VNGIAAGPVEAKTTLAAWTATAAGAPNGSQGVARANGRKTATRRPQAPRLSLRDRCAALVVELRSTLIHARLIAVCLSLLRLIDLSSFPSERFKASLKPRGTRAYVLHGNGDGHSNKCPRHREYCQSVAIRRQPLLLCPVLWNLKDNLSRGGKTISNREPPWGRSR
jgi:hypothetical protein